MKDYVIITDSCCDLPSEIAQQQGLEVIPLTVTIDGKNYVNYLDGREISSKEFYNKLRSGLTGSTSAVNPETFISVFEKYLEKGLDIIYLGFSSVLSSTYQSSMMAAEDLSERYPDSKIYCVDTLCASMGEGLIVYLAAQLKNQGKSIDEVRDFVESKKLNLCHWFTVEDLNHLKRGGRVSATTAFLGSLLNIKPVLHMDDSGHLVSVEKARGRRASIVSLFEHMKETVTEPDGSIVFISHGDSEEEAQFLADMVKKEYKVKQIIVNDIGPVIGAHSGPGTLAIFFLGTKR